MAKLHISLDLSPLPSPDATRLRFGLQICGAADTEADARARVDALRLAIDAIAGDMPVTYADEAAKKPWVDIEVAFAEHLGECLPWTWTARSVELVVGANYLPVAPKVLTPSVPALGSGSIDIARRGFLMAVYRGSKGLTETERFVHDSDAGSGVAFSFFVYGVQATRWPAPMPQEVFRTVMVLEIERAVLEKAAGVDPKIGVAAVLGCSVDGRDYPLPAAGSNPTVGTAPPYVISWDVTSNAGADVLKFESAGLRCGEMLVPPASDTSFLHPAETLWLKHSPGKFPQYDPEEVGPGCAIGDHDWWSRLHDGVSAAGELPHLLIQATRSETVAEQLRQNFGETVLVLVGLLRDLIGPGMLPAPQLSPKREVAMYPLPRPPVMLDLLAAWRATDPSRTSSLDLLAVVIDAAKAGWVDFASPPSSIPVEDLQEIALVYCVLWRELFKPCTSDEWYASFRTLSKVLASKLPDDGPPTPAKLTQAFEHLTHVDRLEVLDTLRSEAITPAVRAAGLFRSWMEASHEDPADLFTLKAAKKLARAFLGRLEDGRRIEVFLAKQDVGRLFAATAGVDLVRLTTQGKPAEDPERKFAEKIADAVRAHLMDRLSGATPQHPRVHLSTPYATMDDAINAAANDAHRWIFRREGVPSTGQPGPLVLQLDTLHDDSDLQGGETDLNQWLNGYAAFYRRSAPAKGESDWGCGQIGVIEAQMWPDRPVMLDPAKNPLPSLSAEAAATSYAIRQVLLSHDNRPMMPVWGGEVIGDTTEQATDWTGAEGFAVVEPEVDLGISMASAPYLAFGIDYEAVAFAQGRSGVHPYELAGTHLMAPYLFDPAIDMKKILTGSPHVRKLAYRRLTTVSAPRVVAHAFNASGTRLPADWGPRSVSKKLDLAHGGWPMGETGAAKEGREVCVLLSKQGLATPEDMPPAWCSQSYDLQLPTCTHALYDRWIGYDCATASVADKPAWEAWRARMHASELVISAWQGDIQADEATRAKRMGLMKDERAQLDDPAVAAFVLNWRPLRSDASIPETFVVPLIRPTGPLTPSTGTTDEAILFERNRAAPEGWTLKVRVVEGTARPPRFAVDAVTTTVVLSLWPGEIGDLDVSSGMLLTDLNRCGFTPETVVQKYAVFEPWRARFEVATAHFAGATTLFEHCVSSMNPERDLSLQWWRVVVPDNQGLSDAQLELDNVGELAPQRQVWHGTGRPLPSFPSGARWLDDMLPLKDLPDDSPDPSSSAVLWDAIGFAERLDDAAVWTEPKKLGIRNQREVLHRDPANGDPSLRYVRYGVQARQRYEALYRGVVSPANLPHFDPRKARNMGDAVTATGTVSAVDPWIRAFRPGAGVHVVQRPAIRMVVPLTRSLAGPDASAADLLVVLNEELGTPGSLTSTLEACVAPVTRVWAPGDETTLLEQGPDPILTKASQSGSWISVPCVGPLGHTFDTDSREPRFVGTSFVVQTGSSLKAWDFAKLAFRRVLLPELLNGYYPQPSAAGGQERVTPVKTSHPILLTGVQLQQHWQGHLTLAELASPKPVCNLRVQALGQVWSVALRCVEVDKVRTWSAESAAVPSNAFLDTDWRAVQRFASMPRPDERIAKADFRIIAAKVRDAYDAGVSVVPARWEIAGYVAVSVRPERDAVLGGVTWDRRWTRVLTWQLDEPADFATTHVSLAASVEAGHGVAQALPRVSEYTAAEWVQTLPTASSLSIDGKAWVERKSRAPLGLKVIDPKALKLRMFEGGDAARLNWGVRPVAIGDEGQGLHHVLLVTRRAQTADGSPSEAYIGLFNRQLDGDFAPMEALEREVADLKGSALRGYVMLVQKSARTHSRALGFWQSVFPEESEDPRATRDARLRILAVSEPIDGID